VEVLKNYSTTCIVCPEMSGWFGSLGAYNRNAKQKDTALYLKLFDCEAVSVRRKTGDLRSRNIFMGVAAILGKLFLQEKLLFEIVTFDK